MISSQLVLTVFALGFGEVDQLYGLGVQVAAEQLDAVYDAGDV